MAGIEKNIAAILNGAGLIAADIGAANGLQHSASRTLFVDTIWFDRMSVFARWAWRLLQKRVMGSRLHRRINQS